VIVAAFSISAQATDEPGGRKSGESWKISRVISYGHQPPH
jgi:hypothetical protein